MKSAELAKLPPDSHHQRSRRRRKIAVARQLVHSQLDVMAAGWREVYLSTVELVSGMAAADLLELVG